MIILIFILSTLISSVLCFLIVTQGYHRFPLSQWSATITSILWTVALTVMVTLIFVLIFLN